MSQYIDINDREGLKNLLLGLDLETVPLWGKMCPRQMVEHLVDQVQWTNGKKITTCGRSPEEAAAAKQMMIYTGAELPKNFFLKLPPDDFEYPNMEAAIEQLLAELDDFDHYFKVPGTTSMHGGFGPLTYDEWVIWHGKHFAHHFKQFGLIEA